VPRGSEVEGRNEGSEPNRTGADSILFRFVRSRPEGPEPLEGPMLRISLRLLPAIVPLLLGGDSPETVTRAKAPALVQPAEVSGNSAETGSAAPA